MSEFSWMIIEAVFLIFISLKNSDVQKFKFKKSKSFLVFLFFIPSLHSVTACLWRHSSSSLGYSLCHAAAAAAVTLFFYFYFSSFNFFVYFFSLFLYLFCYYLLFLFIFLFFLLAPLRDGLSAPLPLLYARPIRWWHIVFYQWWRRIFNLSNLIYFRILFYLFILFFLLSNMPMCWTQAARIRVQNFAALVAPFQRR